jgi:FtsP/CotA-like multicopper oxidase with cupredoxin domain
LDSKIHTHGLQVTVEGNGDNPFLLFKPGETFSYEIQIPPDQPAGLFWHHPHTAAPRNGPGRAWRA